jgi:MFS family permease
VGPPLWSVPFALVTAATTAVFFGLYFLVLAVPGYAAALGAGPALVGVVVSLPSITAAASRLAVSGVARRRGQKPFLLIGLVLFAGAAAGHAFVTDRAGLVAVRALLGVGWGWTSTALGTLVTELTPAARRGEAIGVWGLAPTIAMAAGPAAGAVLLADGGHVLVFLVSGVLAIVSAVLVAPVHEPPPAPAETAERTRGGVPAAAGGLPRGAFLPSAVAFLSSLSYGAVIAFLPLEMAASPGRAGAWFSLYAATILIARPALGRLSDRAGRLLVLYPSLIVGGMGMLLLAAFRQEAALWSSAVLYGLGIGGGAFPALMALTVDRCPPAQRGSAMAVYFTAYDLSIACGAAMMGPLYAIGGLSAVSSAAAAGVLAGLLLLRAGTVRRSSEEAA